jgi:hypothetical protein
MRNDWGVHYAENESVLSTGSGVTQKVTEENIVNLFGITSY